MPRQKREFNARRVIALIHEYRGNLSAVAGRLGVSRDTVYRVVRERSTVQAALVEARETMKDHAESVLYRAVLNGERWAVTFFLRAQARDRGYAERQEHALEMIMDREAQRFADAHGLDRDELLARVDLILERGTRHDNTG